MKKIVLVTLFLLSINVSAEDYPGSLSAQQLVDLCQSNKSKNIEKCQAFIAGVRAGMAAQRMFIGYTMATQKTDDKVKLLMTLTTKEPMCTNKTVSNDELVASYLNFMAQIEKNNPKMLQGGAGTTVLLGLQQGYPCS